MRRRLFLFLGLAMVAAGCGSEGLVGITKTDGQLTVISGCSESGFRLLQVTSADSIENGDPYSVTGDPSFTAAWQGPREDAPHILLLESLDHSFDLEGSLPDPNDEESFIFRAVFAQSLAVPEWILVGPSNIEEDTVLVTDELSPDRRRYVTRQEFDSLVHDCTAPPTGFVAGVAGAIAAGIALTAFVAYYNSPTARRRRNEKHPGSPMPPPPTWRPPPPGSALPPPPNL